MKKTSIILLFFYSVFNVSWSQELYYLQENFERIDSAYFWYADPIIANKQWKYTFGGQWESGGIPYNPEIPIQGNFNAGLYFPNLVLDSVKLISPTLELNGAKKPMLRFWHCQYDKILKGPDFLKLLFRAGPHSPWEKIEDWKSSISFWQEEVYDIADLNEKYLTDTFQLAFEGIIGNGYGVYIDSVTVLEEEIVPKFVKKATYTSVNHTFIPAGATDIPLERVKLRILGNTGKAYLDSLTLIPQGTGINYLEESSFKLFYSRGEFYGPFVADTSALIATASLNGGKIVFANIKYNMLLGDNNFWVVGSFKNSLIGDASLSFSIPENGINVSDTLFPQSQVSFTKTHLIKESVIYDDFESGGPGWLLQDNFEIGWPEGNMVGIQSNPNTPYNGLNILATDLDGGYYPNISSGSAYYAYMPEIDLTYYFNVKLYMHTFMSINGSDNAVIDISTNGGTTWQNIWASDAASNNSYWSEFIDQSINEIAKRQPKFQLRFGITKSQSTPWPGFSIDNFAIVAEKLYSDVGVTEIIHPYNECLGCNNDTVKVWIRNYAVGPAPSVIPVYYGLWGLDSVIVKDTLYGGIAVDDSVLFTFSKTADFPIGDYYDNFIVGVNLSGDQDPLNDTLTKPLIIQNYYLPPITEDFEYKGGIWLPKENSTWKCKDMTGTIPTNPESPNIWVLSPYGNYANNDTSYVESGCFDLSDESRNMIQFRYWSDCEVGKDGARFEYSIDNGTTWKYLEDPLGISEWNWTLNNVSALNSLGWSGLNEWTTAKTLVPEDADSVEKVKFRLIFMSDAANSQAQGFAFDDFSIFPAPPDVGVSYIDFPRNACQFENSDTIKLYVKNYGYTALSSLDTIIIGANFESLSPVIDSFNISGSLLPGDSIAFNMYLPMDIDNPGTYNLFAYTMVEDNPYYYGTNNDTTWKTFTVWQNPVTNLDDTVYSREPDTLVIRPLINPKYSYLWGDGDTTNYHDVIAPGFYYLTVTESDHGCITKDSTLIQLLFNDVGISQILSPLSSCELGASEKIELEIFNFGTDSLVAGDKISVYYNVNSGPFVKDSVILTSSFYAKTGMPLLFEDKTENFVAKGDYSIKAFAYFGGDTVRTNDTLNTIISVFGYPTVDLGNDVSIKAVSYDLAAPSGFAAYLWNDGDTNQVKLVTSPGTYSLTATDIHGCPGSDNIYVWLKIRDVSVADLASPLSSCDRSGPEKTRIAIQNTGTDTIKLADNIYVSYKLNTGTRVSETFHVNNLLPGQTSQHEFIPSVDLSSYATYNFNLTASTDGDLRSANDTLEKIIYTSPNPVVDLGIEDDDVFKQTSYTFDAGAGSNYNYLWHDGSTSRYYTATDMGIIKVLVTDANTGCYGGDTATLYLDILDYMVSSISIASSPCQGLYDDVTVTVRNSGNLSRGGAEFSLQYYLGNQLLFTENHEWTKNWLANQNLTFNASQSIYLSNTGTDNLRVIIDHDGDLRPENDTLAKAIDIKPQPVVDLGGPTIYTDLPYTIDAGSGYAAYLWNTGATSSTLTVSQNGLYIVTVTGSNGCEKRAYVGINVVVGIDEKSASAIDLKVYPNPATDNVTIEAVFNKGGTYIMEIYNSQNSLVLSREINTDDFKENFSIGGLASGIYIVRVHNKDTNHVSKLIIR